MNTFSTFLPILFLLLFIPIFLSGRKQRKQMQEMQHMQAELSEGDMVITTSGLRGTVVDSGYEETIDLEIAPGVVTTWLRAAIREKITQPAGDGSESDSLVGATEIAESSTNDNSGGRATA
ncbi:MAG: preprotein translocase subunit YajC [Pseudonocardia sp.]|nr:preprotein translocase subunit YajC [Pseudonocardia sp.]